MRNLSTGLMHSDTFILTYKPFEVDSFMEACEKYQITEVLLPTSHLGVLLNSQKFISNAPKSLHTFMAIGSILSKKLRIAFEEHFPEKDLRNCYGMTETSIIYSPPMQYKIEFSVGSLMLPNNSVKIVDEEGNNVDNGQHGELLMKTPFEFLVSFLKQ